MANHKSAKKRARQTIAKTEVNRSRKSEVRTALKKIRTAIEEKNKEVASSLLPKTQALLDRLAKSGIIKKENASRKNSRLASRVSSL